MPSSNILQFQRFGCGHIFLGDTIQLTTASVQERSTKWVLKEKMVAVVMLDSTIEGYLGFWSDNITFKSWVLRKRGNDLRVAVRFGSRSTSLLPGDPAI